VAFVTLEIMTYVSMSFPTTRSYGSARANVIRTGFLKIWVDRLRFQVRPNEKRKTMTNEELAEKVTELLLMMAPENQWPVKKYQMITLMTQVLNQSKQQIMEEELEIWKANLNEKINHLIKDWEDRMPEDSTFYSLGLRHAQDILQGREVNG
jgi:hypothetical protein